MGSMSTGEWNHETVPHKEIALGLQRECKKDGNNKLERR